MGLKWFWTPPHLQPLELTSERLWNQVAGLVTKVVKHKNEFIS